MAKKCLQASFDPGTAKIKAQKATIHIEVTHGGGTCNVFSARNSVNATGFAAPAYNPQKTADLSSVCSEVCGGGTYGGVTTADPASVENVLNFNATEVATGVFRGSVYFQNPGTYTVTLDVTDKTAVLATDANSYSETVVSAGGWTVVDFDLNAGPDAVIGGGWVPSALGAQTKVTIGGVAVGDEVRVGDIEAYASREDIKRKDVVTGTCVTAIEPSQSRSRNTDDCGDTEYDSSGKENTISFTIGKTTSNSYVLDVTSEREVEVNGYVMQTAVVDVEAVTINGINYGKVQFSDIFNNGCGFSSAYVDSNCGKVMLNQVNSRTPVALGDQEYMILDGIADPTQLGVFLVDDVYVGKQLTVKYQKSAVVKRVVTGEEIQDRTYKAFYSVERSDGTVREYEIVNFAPTSFTEGAISSTETSNVTVEGTYDKMIISRAV